VVKPHGRLVPVS